MTVKDIKQRILNGVPIETFEDGTTINGYIASAKAAIEGYIDMPLDATVFRQYFDRRDVRNLDGIGDVITTGRTPVISSTGQYGKDWVSVSDDLDYVDYTTGFPVLPDDIAQVLFNLAMFEINRATGNTYNLSTKTVVTGSATVNISKAPTDFYRDELKRLYHYKSLYYPVMVQVQSE